MRQAGRTRVTARGQVSSSWDQRQKVTANGTLRLMDRYCAVVSLCAGGLFGVNIPAAGLCRDGQGWRVEDGDTRFLCQLASGIHSPSGLLGGA